MSDIKTVSGRMEISVWVNCPHCDNYINLLDESDTSSQDHNEDGHILKQTCPDGDWSESHDSFEVEDVTCSECENSFNVQKLEW